MDIQLKPEYEKMVREHVNTGAYSTESAVVEKGLRLLQVHEGEDRAKFDGIMNKIQSATDQLDRGEGIEYNSVEYLVADVAAEGRARKLAELKSQIQIGLDQLQRGEFTSYDSTDDFAKRIKGEGHQSLQSFD